MGRPGTFVYPVGRRLRDAAKDTFALVGMIWRQKLNGASKYRPDSFQLLAVNAG